MIAPGLPKAGTTEADGLYARQRSPDQKARESPTILQQANQSMQERKDLLTFLRQGAVRARRELSTTGRGEIPKQKRGGPLAGFVGREATCQLAF